MTLSRAPGYAQPLTKTGFISFEGHFHAGMAWLFVLVAVTGFAPRSFAIVTGKMALPPLVVHLHAAVMASWVVLLAVQATLSLAGRMDLHRKWGLASLVAAPLVLLMLIAVTVVRQNAAAGTPGGPVVNNILFLQIRSILLFPTLLAVHLYLLLLLVPALLYDVLRLGRIHRAWVWGLALTLPWVVATEFVWGSHWWRGFGPKLVGAG